MKNIDFGANITLRYIRLTLLRLSSVTLVHPTQRVEVFGNILHHLIA